MLIYTSAQRIRTALLAAAVSAALVICAGAASALTIDPNPVAFDQNGVSGSITLTDSVTGVPSGGDVLVGVIEGDDDTMVFQVALDSGSNALDAIGGSVIKKGEPSGPTLAGGGDIPDDPNVNEDITGASKSGSTGIVFEFLSSDGNGTLEADETSDPFFISYESLATDGSLEVRFMISPGGGSSDFTVASTIVPEPATLALIGFGVGGLALLSGRRRGRRV